VIKDQLVSEQSYKFDITFCYNGRFITASYTKCSN